MNPRARFPLLVGFTLATLSLIAQEQKIASPDSKSQTGTIEGRVICSDTRRPARFASVLVIPIPTFDAQGNATLPKVKGRDITKTNLEGSYTLLKIAPGDYFVVAEMAGYRSPVAQFRWDEVKEMTPVSMKKLAEQLPSVHVEPGKTASAELVLERGAVISGKVTYDDGSPVIGAWVRVQFADNLPPKEHRLILGLVPGWGYSTDDRGRYRIGGLPDGEYVLETFIQSNSSANQLADLETDTDRSYGSFPPDIGLTYAEKTPRKKDAKVYKITSSEELSDADIEIPLHGTYNLSGTVSAQGNQPPIVWGLVAVQDINDKTFTRQAVVSSDGSFQFAHLPPAKYELETDGLSNQLPSVDPSERKPEHHYGSAAVTVEVIDHDVSEVNVTVPEQDSKQVQRPAPQDH